MWSFATGFGELKYCTQAHKFMVVLELELRAPNFNSASASSSGWGGSYSLLHFLTPTLSPHGVEVGTMRNQFLSSEPYTPG